MYKKMRLFLLVPALISVLLLSACTNSVEFTINFDSNGGSEVSSIKTDGTSSITLPNDPIKDGYSFAGWYWDNSTFRDLFTVNSLLERGISGNLTVYAKWNKEDTPIGAIKVTFNSMGGSEVNPQYVQKDNTIAIPNTSKVGYTLDGWYTSLNNGQTFDEKWSFTNNKVTTDITLYAKWIINQYTITFNTNGGSSVSSISQDYDTLVIAPANPTKLGYTFSGWSQPVPIKMPAEDVTLIAEWSINQYTITFDSNGGSPVTAITQDYATTVSKPTDPTKVGYTFAGWYSDSNLSTAYTFTTMPAEDITLYAKWNIITYSINYELADGLNHLSNPSSYTIETNTIILSAPTKEGYTFEGWYSDSNFTNYVSEITIGSIGNLTLYAKWNINSYNITYYIHPDDYDPLKDISLAPGETIIQVSLGYSHSAALTSNGRLFTWGYNDYGQLGDGSAVDKYIPIEITNRFSLATEDKIIQVSLGGNHSVALTSNGRLFTWGYNYYGELGDGTTTYRYTPTEITNRFSLSKGDKIIQVSLGTSHSAALTSNGRLFTWGYNQYGKLGDGTTTNRSTPTEITNRFSLATEDKIIQVSLGGNHSAALTSNGRLFTWGYNWYGQLGDGTTTNGFTPTEITSRFILATEDKIIQVSLGGNHSAALTSSGRLFTWGYNHSGQLGDFNAGTYRYSPKEITNRFSLATEDKIIQVSLGTSHSAALTSSGRLFTWGSNYNGQLGDEIYNNRSTPTEITNRFSLATGDKIIRVSLSNYISAALTSNGRLFTWGYNKFGQLGDGTNNTNRYSPTQITQAHYELLHSDTVVYNQSITEYVPTREGYTFSGWYSDINLNTPYIFGSMPAEDITLNGKWVSND